MSGPALRHKSSHASIHEAALNEARELTELLDELLRKEELDKALETAYVTLEHWETRTLKHAESEEEGLYKEIANASPELQDEITALIRDHALLRELVAQIKELLANEGACKEVVQRFYALIIVDELHNHLEETVLPEE
ncbi:hypothetical protein GCM10011391_31410 [Pullulanibacillus camelliae]|uniref:Hemerythrin-like domain-containing protein n=1 Tax=Pullulanibacillus camelliae TaxID=1707096 RepID=A0A8J3E070_9BACL|nr:hemerythrin domain-containing protein [Pullulanibacillus camelliae]GGE50393.1 hypothetical protein GCM10011391_31410 [Pullulanibacillus camelliae]